MRIDPVRSASTLRAAATALLLTCLAPALTSAQGFGGPDAVENQLATDQKPATALFKERVVDPWFEWKDELAKDTGFSFGVDYSTLYLDATRALGNDSASSGMVRAFGFPNASLLAVPHA